MVVVLRENKGKERERVVVVHLVAVVVVPLVVALEMNEGNKRESKAVVAVVVAVPAETVVVLWVVGVRRE